MSQYIHLLSCILLSLTFYSFYAEKIYNPTHEKDVAIFFFLHDGSGSFPERTQFLGVGAQGTYSSDGFGDKNHLRFNHFDALKAFK